MPASALVLSRGSVLLSWRIWGSACLGSIPLLIGMALTEAGGHQPHSGTLTSFPCCKMVRTNNIYSMELLWGINEKCIQCLVHSRCAVDHSTCEHFALPEVLRQLLSVLCPQSVNLTQKRTTNSRVHLHNLGVVDFSLCVTPQGSCWVYSHFALHLEIFYVTRNLQVPFFSFYFFPFAARNSIAFLNRDLFSYSFYPSGWLLNGIPIWCPV